MRKKYLSALLFGALLVTSAGTFTSCKDYDDDINNLQEQINKVASDLESLKTTVDNLGGVTDVKIEGGKLLVTAGGQTVSYDLPAAAEVEQTTVELDGQDLKVNGEVIGQVGDKVTVNEDGYLCVNGTATEIKAGKYAVLVNDANGVVTITLPDANGELKTIELAKAVSSLQVTAIEGTFTDLKDYNSNTNKGIFWAKPAADNNDWKGPKGAIKANSLLFGQISEAQVSVLPSAFDLKNAKLELVNSKGEVAPVTVTATATEGLLTGSRADAAKLWNLAIAMNSDAKETSFATSRPDANILYALTVNGTVVSGYEFKIDTRLSNEMTGVSTNTYSSDKCLFNSKKAESNAVTVEAGTTTFKYVDSKAYDYYIAIDEADINDADAYGIKVENNTITVSEAAAGKSIKLNVYAIDVNGALIANGKDLTLKVKGSSVEAVEVQPVNYVVKANQSATVGFTIDLGTTFSGLTADEAINVKTVTWENCPGVKAEDNTFLFTATPNVAYYEKADDATSISNIYDSATNIKKVRYAKISGMMLNTKAKPGNYTLTLTMKNADGNEVKKVNVPVTVSLPSYSDLFTERPVLVDGLATVVLDGNTAEAAPKYNVSEILAKKAEGVKWNYLVLKSNVEKTANITNASNDSNSPVIVFDATNNVDDNGAVKKNANISGTYYLVGNTYKDLKVEVPAFDVKFVSPFADTKFEFYKDGAVVDVIPVTVDDSGAATIADYESATKDTKAQGLAISAFKQLTKAFNSSYNQYGVRSSNIKLTITDGTATLDTDGIKLTGMSKSASYDATITVTITDLNGIVAKRDIKLRVN